MRSKAILWSGSALCACFTAVATAAPPAAPEAGPIVRTPDGELKGVADGGTLRFLGVPYAKPPLGDLRWRSPRPLTPWAGTRNADHSGPACPQTASDLPPGTVVSEDCLYLDVVAPAAPSARLRPVMVWFHGGGFSGGVGSEVDPTKLASENDVVVVTTDHRLGVFGLFGYKGLRGSGTFMLQDQQAALHWVQRSIRAFGGDPHNVTLFGQSGGAIAVCGQLTSPSAKGLFQRAILQSGACDTSAPRNGVLLGSAPVEWWLPLSDVERTGREIAEALGCGNASKGDPLSCLRGKSADGLLPYSNEFVAAAYETPILPEQPARALRAGHFQHVPVISGHTTNEWRLILAIELLLSQTITAEQYPALLEDSFGEAASAVEDAYPLEAFDDAGSAFARVMTDRMFACPQLATGRALAQHVPTYAYEFADEDAHPYFSAAPPPGFKVGAAHASELAYLFDLESIPAPASDEQQQLARDLRGYWAAFARNGNPNGGGRPHWPPARFDLSLAPGPNGIEVVDAAEEHHCELWSTLAHEAP